jgi:hypothetical protein
MKKLSILAILIGLFLNFSIAAQIKPQKDEKALTTAQKMLPLAMAMSLSVLGEMHDEQNLTVLTIFQRQIGYWSEELKPVVEMETDIANYKRLDIALTATKAIRAKSTASDRWQMLVGERFGTIYAMIKKKQTAVREINEDDLKFDIEVIGLMAKNAPTDIPSNVTAKFKEFGKLKETDNLTSDKNLSKIAGAVVGILNTISK